MSRGQKFVALSVLTFIAIVVAGAIWGHHGGDTTGASTTGLSNYQNLFGARTVPVSQAGLNQLASQTGHVAVSVNFTWTLLTGFLVLFMQVGFAFLVTGLTRAKNAAHMMMMNIAAFAVALLAYYAVGFAFQFGGVAPVLNLGGAAPKRRWRGSRRRRGSSRPSSRERDSTTARRTRSRRGTDP